MKRIFLAALSASLLLVAAPSAASAHHARHHAACTSRHHHHARCSHARAHVLSFGPVTGTSGSTTSPTTPTSGESAGTVTSYIAPTLTITLNDKKTEVSGKVTENTEILCETTTPTTGGDEGDDDGGSEGGDDGGSEGGDSHSLAGHADAARAADVQSGDDEGDDDGNLQPCTASALVPGAIVRAAELVLGNEGAVWEKVILVS